MSQVKFLLFELWEYLCTCVRVLVYSGSAHRELVPPLLIAAGECCWAACIAADTSTESQSYSSPLSHPPPFLTNLYGILRHSIVGALWKWKPFISDDDPFLLLTVFFTLTWTKILAQTTLAGVGACETIPWLCENLWKWICESCSNGFVGTQLLYFLADVELHFRWDVEHDGGGGAEPQPLTGHACHDDAGDKKIW